ncbi:MAG: hypothetical protein ACLUD2_12720 [Clostridium sp.]
MGKANQAINVDKYDLLVSLRFIRKVPFYKNTILIVAIAIILLIVVLYWFFGTELGCSSTALPAATIRWLRAQGINTDFNRVLGLMISNGLVALSGAMLCQYQGFADINMVPRLLLSSAWLQLSSVKRSLEKCSAILASSCLRLLWARSSITWFCRS